VFLFLRNFEIMLMYFFGVLLGLRDYGVGLLFPVAA
jgi:hypothetical protein